MATPAEIEVLVSQRDFEASLAEVSSLSSVSADEVADSPIEKLVPSVSQAEMQHYAQVQSRFSGVTMNSQESLAKKEIAAAKPNGSALPYGIALPNGVYVNGHAASSDEDEPLVKKDKGKGKAREQ